MSERKQYLVFRGTFHPFDMRVVGGGERGAISTVGVVMLGTGYAEDGYEAAELWASRDGQHDYYWTISRFHDEPDRWVLRYKDGTLERDPEPVIIA